MATNHKIIMFPNVIRVLIRATERPRLAVVWISIFIFLTAIPSVAQQALQNMEAGNAAADSRARQMESPQQQDYTLKNGDFRLLVMPSLGLQYNDNINLANTNRLDDVIVTPAVGITASYPLSKQNLLFLDVSLGYNWYVQHSRFSTFSLNSSSGTGLSFDFVIKDFTFDLHDWINYTEGAGQYGAGGNAGGGFVGNTANGSVANTANYGTLQNTAGLKGTWDLNQINLSLGYDHQNIISTSSQFDNMTHSSEMVFARAGLQVHPKVSVGLETTAALTTYQQSLLNDNNAYTLGPYIEFKPDKFLTITARGGYETYQFQNTSSAIQTGSQDGWYAGVSITHQPTDFLKYSLDAGREVQLGSVSDLLEDWYVRPNVTWTVIKDLTITTFFFYEHGNQGVGSTGNLPGYANGTFDWYGGGVSLQHALTARLALSLAYQCTQRSANGANNGYTQNLIALQLTYHPK